MSQITTPGVYIVEKNAFPNAVVEVATAVPAFMGYTEKALRQTQSLTMVPTRITSLAEFETLFGYAPLTKYRRAADGEPIKAEPKTNFLLHKSMRLFFDNGGSTCWIVSLGNFGDPGDPIDKSPDHFLDALTVLEKEPEPTMLVAADAVLLAEAEWATVSQQMMAQCAKLMSRIAILDVFAGDKPRIARDAPDVIDVFRKAIVADEPSYGVAYYPWVNSDIVSSTEIDFRSLSTAFARSVGETVKTEMRADVPDISDGEDKTFMTDMFDVFSRPFEGAGADDKNRKAHGVFMVNSAAYRDIMKEVLRAANILPPSAGLAGVYARTDANYGVFEAPANTVLASVLTPCVTISQEEQEDLNVPIDGRAVNAIRTFTGRGVLVWGARTLDGNSRDWRYVSVRRTMIFLEQSIKVATEAYVFAPNTSGTWVSVANMIRSFLNNQWKAGALVGATPDEAYQVSVGLGSTMTGNDILDGLMKVSVKVAVERPAEFFEITFQQKMQTS